MNASRAVHADDDHFQLVWNVFVDLTNVRPFFLVSIFLILSEGDWDFAG